MITTVETKSGNKRRRFEIDVVKFFAILFMAFIHVYENMSVVDCSAPPSDAFGNVIEFLGGPLSAPVFMFTMGIGMVFTHHDSPEELAKRGIRLFASGYVLNFLRGTLPLLATMMMGIDPEVDYTLLSSLMITDILQFAGLSFLLTARMKKYRVKPAYILIIALLMQAAGSVICVWSEKLPPSFLAYAAGLFVFAGGVTCFPLLTWFVYPAVGMCFGVFLLKDEDIYRKALPASLAVLAATLSYAFLTGYDVRNFYALADEAYYRQDLFSFLFTISVVIAEISIAFFIFRGGSAFISFCSINLTRIYIIHWIVITVIIAVMVTFELGDVTKGLIIPYAIMILCLSIVICRITLTIGTKRFR